MPWMRITRFLSLVLCLLLQAYPAGAQNYLRPVSMQTIASPRSVDAVVEHIQWNVAKRLRHQFSRHGITRIPPAMQLIALKEERLMELWVQHEGRWVFIKRYPILAASGDAGPKLREGDYQVPEGLYHLTQLNPNSAFHLSVRVGYPNAFDRQIASAEGRHALGGDIMIHGRAKSKGCLAIGDTGIEEVFYLVAKIGKQNSRILIAPYDMRTRHRELADHVKPWVHRLYQQIRQEMAHFRL